LDYLQGEELEKKLGDTEALAMALALTF